MSQQTIREFKGLADRYFEATFERFPTFGSAVGRHEFDSELELPSEKLFAAHEKLLRSTLAAIENLPETDFGGNDWIDRRALLAELRTELWSLERGAHRSNPDRYVSGAMNSVFELIVKRADDFTPVAGAVVSRLKKIPAYLEGASSLLKSPVPRWQQMALQSAEGAPSLFQAVRDGLVKCGKVTPAKAQALCDAAAQAVAAFAKRTAKLKPGALNSFALGRERFEALIRERLGWDLTAAEAGALGRTLAERLEAEMRAEARRLGGKDPRALLERAAADWKPQHAELFDEYTHQTARVAEAYRDARLVSFPPGEKLLLKRVPEFLRHHFPTAAYSSPGCFDTDQTGIFWVNDLSQTKNGRERKTRRESRSITASPCHLRARSVPRPSSAILHGEQTPQQTAPPLRARDFLRRLDAVVRTDVRRLQGIVKEPHGEGSIRSTMRSGARTAS